ncbi:PA2778 family cysteine peptidase [Lacimicrobium alkaliphilum]|uniref:Peptidase C39 n=1 Tax=Lacimicrobium alkaliphilum TaxID=1526571 RepID=A0A0U2ZEN4_9ALTE|nr:PA2778 family cysteine peptidase [Lacimicrobium alkaliphilum]ALS97591.1 peptidase C39 [Lacimicrobium alkaliphilum]
MAGLLMLLSGCQTPQQTQRLLSAPPEIARQHLIPDIPFYPQQQYFCGPTTLSEVAGFYGLEHSPNDIALNTFVPDLEGSLQVEMTAAARQLGLLAYAQRANMEQLLSLIAENIPVIVLQNNGIAILPQWHYAVVTGYDLETAEVILNTGVTQRHRLNFATFERTWQRGNYWMLTMLPGDKASKHLDPFVYTKACQDLLNTNQTDTGIAALKTATKQWPEYWLPYFLLANHYFSEQPLVAANWFAKGLPLAEQQISYLNNYAILLSYLDCHGKAIELIDAALKISPDDSNLLDSQQQIHAAQDSEGKTRARCRLESTPE